ncbi:MAG: peptide-methionine (S)-S-oxide reductase MsrA [Patescibacteria group bacterium]
MTKKATFAAGCFWGVEEIFRTTLGVKETSVGYTGGKTENPSYEQICTDGTGHAEAVEITYDPEEISYDTLLKIFWENHNPTTFNRQGPDVGSQYRSAIFYHDEEQKELAQKSKEELGKLSRYNDRKIVTQIVPAEKFYPAEEYHQKYLMKRGLDNCHIS